MLGLIVKASVILAAAFGAAALERRSAAAIRHFTWTAAFLALLLLPVTMRLAPQWTPPAPAPVAAIVVTTAPAAAASHAGPAAAATPVSSPVDWFAVLRLLGTGVAAAWFLTGIARMSWMVKRAAPAAYARADFDDLRRELGVRRAQVLESSAVEMPIAWGILNPVVMLPAGAAEWPADRLRTVLMHELLHIRRRDLLSQAVAQAACCLLWFHPLVWLAARRLRQERERACDDAVLLRGVPAHDYAAHLMDLVRALAARRSAWSDAPAIAEASDLESRVRALLDRGRNRNPLSRRAAALVAAGAIAVLLPLATMTAQAQARGSLSGTVEDPSGGRVPGCQVVARNLDGPNQETTRADAAGEYRFASIVPGRYALEFRTPGFALAKHEVIVVAGANATYLARLEIGQVSEAVTVRASRNSTARAAQPARDPQRIRVGGNVQASRLVSQPKPVYPDDLKLQGIQGTVMLKAIISKFGEPMSIKVVNTDIDPRLAQAAVDAVRQWRYTPTLLNGQPVETMVSIDLAFELDQ
jgi:TonB family protein